jgi:hypothetical protein
MRLNEQEDYSIFSLSRGKGILLTHDIEKNMNGQSVANLSLGFDTLVPGVLSDCEIVAGM